MTDKDLNNLPDESSETGWEQMGEQIANTQEDLLKNMNQEFVKFFQKLIRNFNLLILLV